MKDIDTMNNLLDISQCFAIDVRDGGNARMYVPGASAACFLCFDDV